MGEVPAELAFPRAPSISDPEGFSSYLRQYDVFIETTTQMLATPKLHERLLLALEAIANVFGHRQGAIATINERDATLRIRAAVGFDVDPAAARLEMPLDSSAACVRVIHDAYPLWIDLSEDDSSRSLFDKMNWQQEVLALPLFGIPEVSPKTGRDTATSPNIADHYWTFEPGSRLGVLYVGATEDLIDPVSLNLVKAICRSHRRHCFTGNPTRTTCQLGYEATAGAAMDRVDHEIRGRSHCLTDLDNQILLQNRRAEELFSGSANAGEGKRRALKMNDLLFSAYLSSATVSSSEVVQRDITLVDPLEGSDIHFEVISTPAVNARGEPLGLVSIFRDVTDLREANEELARNFVKLQQAEAESRRERDRLGSDSRKRRSPCGSL